MDFERFEEEFSNLKAVFKQKGFAQKPNASGQNVFSKFLDYHLQVLIITSRLEQGIVDHDSFSKYIFECLKNKIEPSDAEMENSILTFGKIMLDLSDFYIYTRSFLDTLTMCIKLSFKRAGNRKWKSMKNSMKGLLNARKMEVCKKEIDFSFFEGLEERISWILDFKKSRDGLLHKYYHFVFTKTRKGEYGYDIMNGTKTSWGTDTVRGILTEVQSVIDNLSDLMEYLSGNLPT